MSSLGGMTYNVVCVLPAGGAGAAALGSVAGIYIIGSLFGVAGAGLAGFKVQMVTGIWHPYIITYMYLLCYTNLGSEKYLQSICYLYFHIHIL